MSKQDDLEFGIQSEKDSRKRIGKHLGCKLKKTKGAMATFDFICRKRRIYVELKTRRVSSRNYKDYMVGYNKVAKGLRLKQNHDITVYICFRFLTDDEDTIFIYKVDKDTFDESWVKKKAISRWDRGRNEISDLAFIPRNMCKEIL